ncbi:polysaccharide biosynthesis protein [Aliifodinibius sp. S!AR15-10]|uniref:polysaccharide biosynthesis protein n=1 Tax=Aliifodinibius sp. S!AR15-10 TaxID=2950437 RepID=UPI00285E84A8|nr:nucleoside-diphosphate sugar epimerase/dehydratase [Aliifodinibius sp. S!AR15-10]MDR8392372.1 polysaccharide biosynthesis protein [Aliifodinibius sp. S!AR15-10]
MEIESYQKKYKYFNKYTRGLFFLVGDTFSLLISASIAYITLLPFTSGIRSFPLEHVLIIICSVLIGLALFRMYVVNWRYASLRDVVRIILGLAVGGSLSLTVAPFFLDIGNYEFAFTTILMINAVLGICGFRVSKRMYFELRNSQKKKKKHTIIFGGESEGEQILRDILKDEKWNLSVHGIFDDRVMPGLLLHGVQILGGRDKMISYIQSHPVDLLIVAFPEMPKKELKEIIDEIKKIRPKVDIKILPSFHTLTDNPVGIEHIRDVSIEDILGREPVNIDINSIKASITGKTVLVTGAGGSIGSELIRQCAKLKPEKLIALDIDETELFHVENEFKGTETEVIPCVASITDEMKMDQILGWFQPDVIYHAAAYKHVPMMESFPEEAIKVNVGGTRSVASLACKHEVEKFIMISTDKAVNPTNVMGATKRVAEEICMAYNSTCLTRFISVRFGNVLGSRGSVVPLFIEQIKNGGPVTITDPEMRRYFMTIPEAVLLVMQAGSMGVGGEVFVLDMGEPVKILDMAKDLIRLHSLEPDRDIPIEFTGRRPGEKLFEELLNAEEGVLETEHEEIFKAVCSRKLTKEELDEKISQLFDLLGNESKESVRFILKAIVPTYSYNEEKLVQENFEEQVNSY